MSEEQYWIKKIKRNSNHKAANRLITKYYREMYAFVYKQTLDIHLSEDLTQEVFIRVLKSIGRFDERKASFRTWLYRVASNQMIDYFRSKNYKLTKLVESLNHDDFGGRYDLAASLMYKEDVEKVNLLINQLPPDYQQIIRLKLFGDYTLKEISNVVQVPLSTVKSRYYTALNFVRKEMEDNYSE